METLTEEPTPEISGLETLEIRIMESGLKISTSAGLNMIGRGYVIVYTEYPQSSGVRWAMKYSTINRTVETFGVGAVPLEILSVITEYFGEVEKAARCKFVKKTLEAV